MTICTRGDHPDRPHYHYGPAGRYWCTDPNSALLYQDGESRGPLYEKAAPRPEVHEDPRQKEPCPECGHRWYAHHHRGEGCLYTESGRTCICQRVNPAIEDEDRAARAAWNAYMGRDPR